jgi:hypothetical protein
MLEGRIVLPRSAVRGMVADIGEYGSEAERGL